MEEVFYLCITGVIIIGIIFGIISGTSYVSYTNNKAYEKVCLDGIVVYSGMSRNVGWAQLGENGTLYYVKEYKVGFWNRFFGVVLNYWCGKDLKVLNHA